MGYCYGLDYDCFKTAKEAGTYQKPTRNHLFVGVQEQMIVRKITTFVRPISKEVSLPKGMRSLTHLENISYTTYVPVWYCEQ